MSELQISHEDDNETAARIRAHVNINPRLSCLSLAFRQAVNNGRSSHRVIRVRSVDNDCFEERTMRKVMNGIES